MGKALPKYLHMELDKRRPALKHLYYMPKRALNSQRSLNISLGSGTVFQSSLKRLPSKHTYRGEDIRPSSLTSKLTIRKYQCTGFGFIWFGGFIRNFIGITSCHPGNQERTHVTKQICISSSCFEA